MKHYLFDTSVMVAGQIQPHPRHQEAFALMTKVKSGKIKGYVSAHGLAELFSVLTKLPLQPPLSPEVVSDHILKETVSLFTVIDLSAKDYLKALKRCAKANLKSGVIYDALHLEAALKKKLDGVVTFNDKDFERLLGDETLKIVTPQ